MTTAEAAPWGADTVANAAAFMKAASTELAWRMLHGWPTSPDVVDRETDDAWRQRNAKPLEQDAVFRRIMNERVPYEQHHQARGTVRGFPRHGFKL